MNHGAPGKTPESAKQGFSGCLPSVPIGGELGSFPGVPWFSTLPPLR
jgi:hypothetical protein